MEDYDSDSTGTGTQNTATHCDFDASSSSGDSDSDLSDSDIEMIDTEDAEGTEDPAVVFSQSAFKVLLASRLQPGDFEDRDLEPSQAFRYQRRKLEVPKSISELVMRS